MRWRSRVRIALRAVLAPDSGQALVELVVLLPTIVVSLVLVAHVLLFASECARFDRAVCEYARANAGVPTSPNSTQGLPVSSILGYTSRSGFTVSVLIRTDLGSPFDTREHVFTLRYRLVTIPALRRLGLPDTMTLRRAKTVIVPHYRAGVRL